MIFEFGNCLCSPYRECFLSEIIKSQHMFWEGALCRALFEVLCYFSAESQGLLHSFTEHGPDPGSCRLTRTVNQMHAQMENRVCLFLLQNSCVHCEQNLFINGRKSVTYLLKNYGSPVHTRDWLLSLKTICTSSSY